MFVLGAAALSACGSPTPPASSLRIANGDIVAADELEAKSTVALVAPAEDGSGALRAFCSGTLISRDLVVTAGHCIDAPVVQVLFGGGFRDTPELRSGRTTVNPGFTAPAREDFTYDMALIHLDTPAPDFMTPAALASPRDIKVGDEVILAGYGLVIPRGKTTRVANPGYLFKTTTSIAAISTDSDLEARPGDVVARGLIKFASADQRSGGCAGDSGGPMYVRRGDRLLLAGSTVGGPGICAPTGFYTNLTFYTPWLLSTAKTLQAELPATSGN